MKIWTPSKIYTPKAGPDEKAFNDMEAMYRQISETIYIMFGEDAADADQAQMYLKLSFMSFQLKLKQD